MVRRPSIASLDSGTESTVYGKAPMVAAGHGEWTAKAPRNDSGSRRAVCTPPDGRSRDITVTVDWMHPGAVGPGAPRLAATYDMSVIDRQSGRWYVKDIRASTQPMGTQ